MKYENSALLRLYYMVGKPRCQYFSVKNNSTISCILIKKSLFKRILFFYAEKPPGIFGRFLLDNGLIALLFVIF